MFQDTRSMNKMKRWGIGLGLALGVVAFPTAAYANAAWPGLFLAARTWAWWAIAIGLLIEWPVVRRITQQSWVRSAWFTLAINAASTVAGAAMMLIVGGLVYYGLGRVLIHGFKISSPNLALGTLVFLIAAAVNAGIEFAVLWKIARIPWRARSVWLLALANLASVGAAFLSLLLSPPPMVRDKFIF